MSIKIETSFTRRLDVAHPIALAPMDKVAGGELAAAVSRGGGLGLIGAGYSDGHWIDAAFDEAEGESVGIGVITWRVMKAPDLIERILNRRPKVLMVSFGDATEIIQEAKGHGIATLWQIQSLNQAEHAMRAGVDVIIVQGQEAGGHGKERGLVSLLPSVRDFTGKEQCILAAGGIADGRGLAAALMLGADGVMMGTRFWASTEASGTNHAKTLLVKARGDETARSNVFDIVRGIDWPQGYSIRTVRNPFLDRWSSDTEQLSKSPERAREHYASANADDFTVRALIAGESIDLVRSIESAETLMSRIVSEAAVLLANGQRFVSQL